ncbi:LPS-assembly protein LptD [Bacteroidetes/Chlorobi group bacterium Naka2016]|nr:MAG: LPS-assembly protein LptD [Bacteroidetes/Chlorobi group bacterium Naka2016]
MKSLVCFILLCCNVLVAFANLDAVVTVKGKEYDNFYSFKPQQEAPKKKLQIKETGKDTLQPQQVEPLEKQIQKTPDTIETKKTELKSPDTTEVKTTIDDIIKFKAQDSIQLNVKEKHLYMRGKAVVEYKTQKLEAEIIEFFFDQSLLKAQGTKTAEGKSFGFPAFTDNKEVYYGERILYNFRTKQGTISLGETQMGEGYYFGDKIKREKEIEFFVQNGCYTTCNAPHPHYYFGSPKMKIVAGESVYLDPLIFYVEDLPIFVLPIGLYFPNRSGRQSGLIVPSFFFSQKRGVTIQNLGLYLALSDYYDTRFSLDFYTKGGFLAKNYTQWKYRNSLAGNFELSYGRVRFSVDEPYQKTWSFSLQHNHKINPFENFTADLRFYSQDFFRNTSIDIFTRQQQDLTSNASYSRTFENGSNLSLSYSRSQNILTTAYTETPSLSFTIPQMNPFRSLAPNNDFLRSVSFQYSLRAFQTRIKREQDSSFVFDFSTKITHSPSLSFQLPKISYFTFTPFFSFSFNNYFRRVTKSVNPTDSSIVEQIDKGFFTEYNYSFGISSSTKLYGIAKPNIFGVKMFRHTVSPSIQYSYTPNLSDPKFGFYGKYFDLKSQREVVYSRFEKDGGGLASRSLYQLLSYSIQNNFSVKYNPLDTGEDKTIDLLNVNISGNYNFAADSLRFSDIAVSIYTTTIPSLNVNSSMGFTLYDQEPYLDQQGNPTNTYHKVNRFLINSGKGLLRLTYFTLSFGTRIGGGQIPMLSDKEGKPSDSLSLGERFSLRRNLEEKEFDFWGENSDGYQPFKAMWSLSIDVNYNYRRDLVNQKSETLNLSLDGSLKLTPTWNIFISTQYDAINKEIISPVIRINKDLHCWDLSFTWYPYGTFTGFYFRFGIKSSVLRDLKIEKRSSPLY